MNSAFLTCKGTQNALVVSNSSNFHAKDCNTDYHCDYYVQNGIRCYYDGIPDVLQIGDHQFAERRLVHSWRLNANLAWVSAGNNAATYLHTHGMKTAARFPESWPVQPNLSTTQVYDAFILLSLLEDAQRRETALMIPHGGLQADRFKLAMRDRNSRIRLYGQPELRHLCQGCVRFYPGAGNTRKLVFLLDYYQIADNFKAGLTVSAVVMDGICIGRPRCGAPGLNPCKHPLKSNRDRFCLDHKYLDGICCIVGCERPVSKEGKTCDDPIHQSVETLKTLKASASFQLKERMKQAQMIPLDGGIGDESQTSAVDNDIETEVYEVDETERRVVPSMDEPVSQALMARESLQSADYARNSITTTGKNKIRARFGRMRTHNEQILVAPCGVIIARETFYNAESIPTVVVCTSMIISSKKYQT